MPNHAQTARSRTPPAMPAWDRCTSSPAPGASVPEGCEGSGAGGWGSGVVIPRFCPTGRTGFPSRSGAPERKGAGGDGGTDATRPPPGPPGARAGRARAREGGRGLYSRYARRYARLVTMPTTAPHALADVTASDSTLRRFLHGLPGVDAVGLEARAASLGTRSIKTTAKAYAIDLAISMVDLTTLEGADTPGKVRALGAKAVLPDPTDRSAPATAAVCVYPDMVAVAKRAVAGSGVKVASVATAFPAGRAPIAVKLADV